MRRFGIRVFPSLLREEKAPLPEVCDAASHLRA